MSVSVGKHGSVDVRHDVKFAVLAYSPPLITVIKQSPRFIWQIFSAVWRSSF